MEGQGCSTASSIDSLIINLKGTLRHTRRKIDESTLAYTQTAPEHQINVIVIRYISHNV